MNAWPARAGIIKVNIKHAFSVRGEFLISVIVLLVQIAIIPFIWNALYANNASAGGVPRETTISYAVIAAILINVMTPWQFSTLPERVQRGSIVIDILRPVGLVDQLVSQQVGYFIATIPRALIGGVFAFLIGALQAPKDLAGFTGFVMGVVLGAGIAILLNLLVGMTAFWTTETSGAFTVYRVIANVGSGALIPLWFMPAGLGTVLGFLPFRQMIYVPLAIYSGRIPADQIVLSLVYQALWGVGLWLVALLVWRRAFTKMVVHGG